MTAYRASGTVLAADLPPFTAVLHRESGITHLLVEPAPDILAALAEVPLTADGVRAHLAERFELDGDGLTARLDELVAAGLVEPA